MNIGKVHFLWKTKITVITTGVGALDIEKTSQGIYTVNHLTNFFLVGASTLNSFLKVWVTFSNIKKQMKKWADT